MTLLTLNLHKRLEWYRSQAERAAVRSPTDAIEAIAKAPEGSELTMAWDWDALVDPACDDGPSARRPLPPPARIAASGLIAPPGDADSGDATSDAERLEPGQYLFTQDRKPADVEGPAVDGWLADSIEWFAREAWWTKAAGEGELTLRLVREDGKTAVQLLRKMKSDL
ncbi:MAG: hypothetical protein CVV47_13345 [Spirochaetae bacterium HGW-Spirochaetae-3]|jgi:hypothetical protein|nr:MAG: hypothetical protein CVV47_13345 [Spirochaetae bacterium HGW-Spirochaetae-3]